MVKFAYHASHEQFKPSELLKYVQMAERAGFTAASSSDHFHPWSERQGQSGFSWAWLGAAMQATELPFGVVCAPPQRYHPAIVAQAAATLAEMFPNRFWVALVAARRSTSGLRGKNGLLRLSGTLACWNVLTLSAPCGLARPSATAGGCAFRKRSSTLAPKFHPG